MFKDFKYEHLDEIDVYFEEIKKSKPLTRKQEQILAEKIQNGDEDALNTLVNANLRFVVNIAKMYRKSGVPFSDLISEGNVGLIRAAKKFDGNRNIKFISYAVWWIKNSIQECINTYKQENCEFNIDIIRLNNQTKEIYEYELSNINNEYEENIINHQSRQSTINELLSCLQERERKIITLYFGLFNNKEHTLEEIGSEMSLTNERIRQIKDKAIMKMRVEALVSDEFDIFQNLR